MIEPQRAVVRPRVLIPSPGPVLLEDEVAACLERSETGMIVLGGGRGVGKTTAIAHLAAVLGSHPRLYLSESDDEDTMSAAHHKLVVGTLSNRFQPQQLWQLLPWGRDDCIEYLLATHRERCASVMQRVQADDLLAMGLPELWRPVLDRLAEDDSLADVRSALRREVERRLAGHRALNTARSSAFRVACHPEEEGRQEVALQWDRQISEPALRLLRHELVRLLLAADYAFETLHTRAAGATLKEQWPEAVVREVALAVQRDPHLIYQLKQTLAGRRSARHPTTASLLHAAAVRPLPKSVQAPLLTGAYLPGLEWPGVQFEKLEVVGANLARADLSEARIDHLLAQRADFSGANLHGARLTHLEAERARFVAADLSYVRASRADFHSADLRDANLEGALLQSARFLMANLRGARLWRTSLAGADFTGVALDDADFSGADLSGARLDKLPLKLATFSGATFKHAHLSHADMEYMVLPGSSFAEADLQEAWLSGSRISGGNFRGANLSRCGLAEIEWERTDLRDANLRYCTFHLGSSRSGLVGSPIVSEGSRTGFYTDEFHEQDFKAPEEICKANLRGADLRGANIDHTDFYLVDLREARYTPQQEDHFRRCGAILGTRV